MSGPPGGTETAEEQIPLDICPASSRPLTQGSGSAAGPDWSG